jgi:hypothetical protein
MLRQSSEFGALVREILAERRLTMQEAALRSGGGVSFGTVRSMTLGTVPGPEKIVSFARAVDAESEANRLLDAAGFRYLRYVSEAAGSVRQWAAQSSILTPAAAGR